MRKLTLSVTALVVAVALLASPVTVLAHNGVDHSNGNTGHGTEDESGDDSKRPAVAGSENRGKRLDAAKLKVCQNRAKNIKAIMDRSVERATKQIALFDKIAERTKAFYVDKGNVLEGYADLVAAVDMAKNAANDDLEDVKQSAATFSCEGQDPKGAASVFRAEMQGIITSLKVYRTAVKNLITGVKSAQGDA